MKFVWLSAFAVLALTAGCGGAAKGGRAYFEGSASEGRNLLGRPAPDMTVTPLEGKEVTLADKKGKVVIVDLWATWCPPCRESMPENERLHKEYAAKGLEIMAISDESKSQVESYIKEQGFTFPVYLDPNGETRGKFEVRGIPTVIILDREGYVVAYLVGLQKKETLAAALKMAGLEL